MKIRVTIEALSLRGVTLTATDEARLAEALEQSLRMSLRPDLARLRPHSRPLARQAITLPPRDALAPSALGRTLGGLVASTIATPSAPGDRR